MTVDPACTVFDILHDVGVDYSYQGKKNRCTHAEWAREISDIKDPRYKNLNKEFLQFHSLYAEAMRLLRGHKHTILDSTGHWSRCFEYPWAIINGELETHHRVLDAGGSLSLFQHVAARLCRELVNLDKDDQALGSLNFVNRKYGSGVNILPVFGDITNLPFPDDSFDRVFCLSVLEDVKEWSRAFDELYRVVVLGGQLVVTIDVAMPFQSASGSFIPFADALELAGEFADTLSRFVPMVARTKEGILFGCLCLKFAK